MNFQAWVIIYAFSQKYRRVDDLKFRKKNGPKFRTGRHDNMAGNNCKQVVIFEIGIMTNFCYHGSVN